MIGKISHYIQNNLTLLGIAILGLLLRLWNLTSISLWHDEAFSALLIKYSWGEMMHRIGLDVHPPIYYIFLRFWSYVFGHSLFSLRGMSVLFGIGTILAVYYFVNYAFKNRTAALLAALLVAINPFQVQYVTEARMYTMGAFFAVASGLALVAALRTQTAFYANKANQVLQSQLKKRFLIYYALFTLCSGILIYTHYYLLFTVAALGLYAAIYCAINFKTDLKRWIWVVLSGLGIGVLFIPWLKIFLFQFKQVGAGYWIPPMDRWSIPSTLWEILIRLPNSWTNLRLLVMVDIPNPFWILVSILTLVIIVQVIRKVSEAEKWLALFGFLAPFGGAILFFALAKLQGSDSSVYLVRYFIFCSAYYSILIALFLSKFRIKQLATLLAMILVFLNLYAVWNYWDKLELETKPGMAAASKFLTANVEPNHKIFVGSSFEFFNYKYYNRTGVKPLLFTDGNLTHNLPHFAGTAILIDDDLVLNFADNTRSGDTVWLIWTNGFGGSQPNVPKNWTEIDEQEFAEVRPYVGTIVYVTQYKVN